MSLLSNHPRAHILAPVQENSRRGAKPQRPTAPLSGGRSVEASEAKLKRFGWGTVGYSVPHPKFARQTPRGLRCSRSRISTAPQGGGNEGSAPLREIFATAPRDAEPELCVDPPPATAGSP